MKFKNLNDYLYLYTELNFLTRFIQSKIGQDHLAPLKYTKRFKPSLGKIITYSIVFILIVANVSEELIDFTEDALNLCNRMPVKFCGPEAKRFCVVYSRRGEDWLWSMELSIIDIVWWKFNYQT